MTDQKYRAIKTVLWMILFANFLVAAIKIGIGAACSSQSVMADGVHSMTDGASNIVGLVGIWLAHKPRDAQHPYGHDKYERMASLFVGIMLAIMAVRIIVNAVKSFQYPAQLNIQPLELILLLATIVINIIVANVEYGWGKRLDSNILMMDSLHTRGDIMMASTVLLGMIGIKLGVPVWIDGVLSIVVATAVVVSAWQIIKDCMDILVDSKVIDSGEIKSLLMTMPEVHDVHQIRSRGERSHPFIDLHIIVNPNENVESMHTLSHELECILRNRFGCATEVNIHIEPDDGHHGEI